MNLVETVNAELARLRKPHLAEPCPMDSPCGNCGHQMAGHWGQNVSGYQTKCSVCPCQHWYCRHGGIQTVVQGGRT